MLLPDFDYKRRAEPQPDREHEPARVRRTPAPRPQVRRVEIMRPPGTRPAHTPGGPSLAPAAPRAESPRAAAPGQPRSGAMDDVHGRRKRMVPPGKDRRRR